MGRIDILRESLDASTKDTIGALINLAKQEIDGGHVKDAADLLRASEHLGFALLAEEKSDTSRISAELQESITEHFDELLRRAEEHWGGEQHSGILVALYESSRKYASKAFKGGAYHRALEFARAAEAIAHAKHRGTLQLGPGHTNLTLKG